MQAIILAAGKGSRLNKLTENNTKCMVDINEEKLIKRMLRQLVDKGIKKVVIVVGYKKENLMSYIETLACKPEIEYVFNDKYNDTNNIYSLYLTKDYLCREDSIIIESDIIFDDNVLNLVCVEDSNNYAVVDIYKSWMTGMGVQINSRDGIYAFVNENEIDYSSLKKCYKTVGIYKFKAEFAQKCYVPFLETYIKCFGKKSKYEQVLRILSCSDDFEVKARYIKDSNWYEINDIQDVDLASTLFSDNEEKIAQSMLGRWGGYWRYPDYLDYFYLVTPYYPTNCIVEEMKANFEDLLIQYPSGMNVNALLAAKEFNVNPENIIIGNGAAELIKSIMSRISGATGFIRPTFDEYPNRFFKEEKSLYLDNDNFSYGYETITKFFADNSVANIVIVNPDNPSGNYICKKDMQKLAEWTKDRNIKLIVDESFVDFVDERNPSLIQQEILNSYPNMYVIKSISKSYGVPGLRLGVLASGDCETISWMKKDVSIWNINSFAEFYMQICGKYRKDYVQALCKFRDERMRFQDRLADFPELRVIPSQANYVMVELLGGIDSERLKRKMLTEKKIFIKTLDKKIKGDRKYLRLAIRDTEDNNRFLNHLREAFDEMQIGGK